MNNGTDPKEAASEKSPFRSQIQKNREPGLKANETMISKPNYSASFQACACPEITLHVCGYGDRVISRTKMNAVIFSQWTVCHGASGDSRPGLIARGLLKHTVSAHVAEKLWNLTTKE